MTGKCVLLCLVTVLTSAVAVSASHAKDVAELAKTGRSVAQTHCSRCHVVDTKNSFGGISSTPSFPLLVNALDDWEERFLTFHTRLPHPSVIRFKGDDNKNRQPSPTVPVELVYTDIEALVAYARTLKKPAK